MSYLATEGLLSRMLQWVHLEGHAALERLAAGLAGERHVLGMSCACWQVRNSFEREKGSARWSQTTMNWFELGVAPKTSVQLDTNSKLNKGWHDKEFDKFEFLFRFKLLWKNQSPHHFFSLFTMQLIHFSHNCIIHFHIWSTSSNWLAIDGVCIFYLFFLHLGLES